MPTFPVYPGELPRCLNPLNPRHYFLLAYWVYFRPTALKCYLYQADPELYRRGPGLGIFRTALVPAYRNLYVVALGAAVLVSTLFGIPIVLLASGFQGTAPDWAGVAVGVAVGVAGGVAGGVAVGVAVGVAGGVAVGVAVGVAGGVAVGVAVGVAFGVAGGVAYGVAFGVAFGVASGVALCVGALRLPMYLAEGGGLFTLRQNKQHPLWWDELTVLPFLQTQRAIRQAWSLGEEAGLQQLAQLAANPFQRWVMQRALHRRLHQTSLEITFLYKLFNLNSLEAYAIAPVDEGGWRRTPSVRQVFVSELAGCGNDHAREVEGFVWFMTKPLRIKTETPLTAFVRLLYTLTWEFEQNEALPDDFQLSQYDTLFSRLADYAGGPEIQQSFGCMAQFLGYSSLVELSTAQDCLGTLPRNAEAIRPPVIQALQQFGRIGQDIAVFQAATSRINQLAALGRVTDALEDLSEYINQTVLPPEKVLLQDIVRRWRKLVSDEIGKLGQITIAEPVPNPYVAGNPVAGDLFVGREEILRELEELWLKPGQVDSVLLYGHRRMGKSSILKNLPNRLDPQRNWVVEFNLQRVGKVSSTGELLYALALDMFDRLPPDANLPVKEPDETSFLNAERNPYQAFNRWLKQLEPHMENRRFIITIDEFELLEVAIAEKRIEAELIEYLRGQINTREWFVIALAGLYTLQEKTREFWFPLFGGIKSRKVSFLAPAATRRLMVQPSADFPLNYTSETIQAIIHLTHGQPYLVQLIGQSLVARFNHRVFEDGQDPDRPISIEDLQAVIESPEFFQDGGAYFTGVWGQAEDSAPEGQTQVLEALCLGEKTLADISADTGLSSQQVEAALATLQTHDVVRVSENGVYAFTVELMRRWVEQRLA